MDSKSFLDISAEQPVHQGSSSSDPESRAANQTEGCHLLHLPLESRIQIYENIFSDHADTDRTNAKSPFWEGARDDIRAIVQPPKQLSVAMTSKQVYREALPIFYKTYHFRLSTWDDHISSLSGLELARQLLAQLRRPLALLMLPSISYLDLFVEWEVAAYSERMSLVLEQINRACVGLQTFCLHMDQLPREWTREAKTFVAGRQNKEAFRRETLKSLRGLANRVRVFKIDVRVLHLNPFGKGVLEESNPFDKYFLQELIPGSAWLLNCKDDRKLWVCQGTEGQKSIVFNKAYYKTY